MLSHFWTRFMEVLAIDKARAIRFGVWGAVGGVIGNLIFEPFRPGGPATSDVETLLTSAFWFGAVGAGICGGLAACHTYRGRLRSVRGASLRGPITAGLVAGSISGCIAQFVFTASGASEFSRILVWGMAGAMLGFGLAPRLPNLPRMRAVLGGGIGGVVGCLLFIPLTYTVGDTVGRILGIPALGFFIGLMIVFADALLRSAWLDLRYPNGRSGTLTLGEDWVAIGTDERAVAVYAQGAPPIGLRYRLANGQVTCEEPARGFAGPVSPGDQRTTGQVSATLRTSTTVPVSASSSSSSSSTTTSPAPRPPMQDRSTPPSATPRTVSIQLRRDTCRIGSASTCEVLVRAPGVAQVHAEVRRSPGRTAVAPIGTSRLDVSISGNPADFRTVTGETALKDGSRLRFGDASATYHDAPSRLEVTS